VLVVSIKQPTKVAAFVDADLEAASKPDHDLARWYILLLQADFNDR